MAGNFNFTANLNIQLNNSSVRTAQAQITSALKGLTVPVNITFSPTAQSGLNAINRSVQTLTANLRTLQAEATRTSTALNLMTAGLGRFNTTATGISSVTNNLSKSTQAAASAAKLGADQFEYLGHQMRLSAQRFVAFSASAGVMLGVIKLFKDAASEAYNFERVMSTISQVSVESASEVSGLGKTVGDIAVKYGVSSKQLINVAEQLKQTGLSIKDVQAAIEPLAKASLGPSFGNIEKVTQGAIAATRQFGIEIKDLEGALGSINAVSAGFAVEANDIIEAVKRAGGAFKSAGGDLHEFNALFTSIRATTRQSAETIATGMRTIFTRLQRTDTIENLKQLGVQLQYTRKEAEQLGNLDLENQFVGPMEAIRRIAQEVRSLSATDPRFSNIAEQIGGYRQISQVIPLLQQGRIAQDAYNTSLSGQISLTVAVEKTENALFRQLERVNQQFLQLGRNVLADTGFRSFLSSTLKLASALSSLMDIMRPLIPMLATFAAFKIGQNIGSLASGILRGPFGGRFHSGGYVSGSGEKPAVLEGGEYVLNKSVVKNVGKSNLDRVNYAAGGKVEYANTKISRGNHVGLFSLGADTLKPNANVVVPLAEVGLRSKDYKIIGGTGLPRNEQLKYTEAAKVDYEAQVNSGNTPHIDPSYMNRYGSVTNVTKKKAYVDQYLDKVLRRVGKGHKPNVNYDGVTVPVSSYPIGAAGRQQALGIIDGNVESAMTLAANELVKLFPIRTGVSRINTSNIKSIVDNAFTRQGKGRFFEGVVQLVRGRALKSTTSVFDLQPVIPSAVRTMFSGAPGDIYADIKLNDNPDARKSVAMKAVRRFGLLKQGQQRNVVTSSLDDLLSDNTRRLEISDSGQNFLNRLTGPVGGNYTFSNRLQNKLNPLFTKKAEGGPVNAMVMPGEVIVPPEQVKRIGINNLRRMNDEGRFAEGGVVQGSGSQDNVPIFLQGGSFVIKKRSAQKLGLSKYAEGGLTPEELEELTNRNIRRITGIAHKRYGRRMGEEARSVANLQTAKTGVQFDPTRVTTGTYTKADIFSEDPEVRKKIDRAFRTHVLQATRGTLRDELRKAKRGGIRDVPQTKEIQGAFGDETLQGVSSDDTQVNARPDRGTEKSRERNQKSAAYRYSKKIREENKAILAAKAEEKKVAAKEAAAEARQVVAQTKNVAPVKVGSMRERLARLKGGPADATPTPPPPPVAEPNGTRGFVALEKLRENQAQEARIAASAVRPGYGVQRYIGETGVDTPTVRVLNRAIPGQHFKDDAGLLGGPPPRSVPLLPAPTYPVVPFTTERKPVAVGDPYHTGDTPVRVRAGDRYPIVESSRRGVPVGDPYGPPPGPTTIPPGRRYPIVPYQGPPREPGQMIRSIAGARTQEEIRSLGGQNFFSDATKREKFKDQLADAEKELTAVTARQIRVMRPGISSKEAELIAEQQLIAAKKNQARIITSQNGQILGLQSNIKAVTAAGYRPDARSNLGGFISDSVGTIGGKLERNTRGIRNWNAQATEKIGGQGALSTMLFVGGGGLSYLAGGLDSSAGTSDDAVRQGRTGSFTGFKAASGLLAGAASGAAIGSLGGVLGAAVGATVGGLAGLTSSFVEASKEIRDARIGLSVSAFTDKINRISNQSPIDRSASDTAGALADIRAVQKEIDVKATYEASRPFSFRSETFADVSRKENRQAFGGQIGSINQTLDREVENVVRRTRGSGDARSIAAQVAEGGNGLNAELIRIVASVRNVPIKQVLDELTKSVVQAQRNIRGENEIRAGQIAEGRNLAAFGRLASAAENASSSLEKMDIQAKLIGETFTGQIAATRITAQTNILGDIGTANPALFRSALGGVSSGLGVGGEKLFQAGNIANSLGTVLPGILAQVVATNPLREEDFTGATRRQIYTQLGFGSEGKGAPEQVNRAVETVIGQLRGLKIEDVIKENQTDVTKLSERLLQPLVGPLKDAGVRAGKALETEANRFIDSLTELAKRSQEIGTGRDKIASLELASTRQRIGFAQQAGFRRNAGVNDIGLDVLNRPFQQRQERLSSLAGAAALDPNVIARRLADVRGRLGGAAQRQQEEFQKSGGVGPRFEAAASELVRLRDQASRLQQALGHLADASERNAGAQEKLANIGQDRDSRLGFGERYLSSSAEEKAQIQRGLILTNQANRAGSIRQLGEEDQKLVLQTLNSLGRTKLEGFQGQPIAADLKDKLLTEAGFGVSQNTAQQEQALQQQVLQGHQQAIEAQQALVGHQEALQVSFFQNLQQSHQQFLTDLKTTLAQTQLADRRVELGQAGANLQQLRATAVQAQVLKSAGITSDSQLDTIRNPRTKAMIDAYLTTQNQRNSAQELFTRAGSLSRIRATGGGEEMALGGLTGRFQAYLSKQDITNYQDQADIFNRAAPATAQRLSQAGIPFDRARTGSRKEEGLRIFEEELSRAIQAQAGIAGLRLAPAVTKAGEDVNKAVGGGFQIQNVSDVNTFNRAVESLQGKSFEQLNTQIQGATTQFQQLSASLAAMQASIGPVAAPPAFAVGGKVPGRPRGTDTVPAWLTPNEYVVNAQSARANASLLERINSARGPVYLADGGKPSDFFGWLFGGTKEVTPHRSVDDILAEEEKKVAERRRANPSLYASDIELRQRAEADKRREAYQAEVRRREEPRPERFRPLTDAGPSSGEGGSWDAEPIATPRTPVPPPGAPKVVVPKPAPAPVAKPALPIPRFNNLPGVVADQIRARDAAAPAPAGINPAAAPGITKAEALDATRRQALANPGGASSQYLLSQIVAGQGKERQGQALARQYYGYQAASLRSRQRLAQMGELGVAGADAQLGIAGTARGRTAEINKNMRNTDWATQELLRKQRERAAGVQRLASGGFVKGGFGGIDDVPANLTRGEFVFSKPAVDALGSAALERMHYLAKGGSVQYLASGGFAGGAPSPASGGGNPPDMSAFIRTADGLSTAMNSFAQAGQSLNQAFNTFSGKADSLAQALSNFPGTLRVEGTQTINVIHNGVETFAQMNDSISQMIDQKTGEAIKNLLKEKFPDA
jgi:TP901 family phage tail tape measure protein